MDAWISAVRLVVLVTELTLFVTTVKRLVPSCLHKPRGPPWGFGSKCASYNTNYRTMDPRLKASQSSLELLDLYSGVRSNVVDLFTRGKVLRFWFTASAITS